MGQRPDRIVEQRAEHRAPRQLHAMPERRDPGNRLDRRRQAVEREERAAEQEQRGDHPAEDRAEGIRGASRGHERTHPAGKRQSGQDRGRDREQRERRCHRTEQRAHEQEHARDEEQAERDPEHRSNGDRVWPDRGRVHGVEDPAPDEPDDHRKGRFEDRDLHGRSREQPRCEEVQIRHAGEGIGAPGIDVAAEPKAHREQEQRRVHERRENRPPVRSPVLIQAMLEHAAGRSERRRWLGSRDGREVVARNNGHRG